jgi:mxaA protein
MRHRWLPALLLMLAPLCGSGADEAAVVVEPLRRYGYVIGDEIEVRAAIGAPPGYTLDVESLPKPGRVNTFLELRLIEREGGFLGRFGRAAAESVSLRFAVVNSSADVMTAETPPVTLMFQRAGAPGLAAVVPQVNFTVSPLTPAHVAGFAGLEPMQPDVAAPAVSARVSYLRLLLYGLGALAIGAYLAWRQGWLPRSMLGNRCFARAVAEIRREFPLAGAAVPAAPARRLHQAFDESAGFAVGRHNVDRFVAERPWAAALAAEIREFFAASAQFFYAGDAAALMPPERVLRLARALADREPRKLAAR